MLKSIGAAADLYLHPSYLDRTCRRPNCTAPPAPQSYCASKMPVDNVAHQVGTRRFVTDPATSVLDLNALIEIMAIAYVS